MIWFIWLKNLLNFYNSNKNYMPRNQIILLKIILLLSYFENEEVIQLFYLSPESLFAVNFGTDTHTACLTRGTKLSSIRLRYRTKLLLWLLIRFGLSNLRVPLQINVFLQTSRVSTMKSTYAPAGNVHNYPFPVCKWQYYDCVFQCCAVTTRWDWICRSSFATCTSSGIMTVAARNRLKTIQCLGIFWYIVLQRDHISKEWFYTFQDFSC